MSRRRLPWTSTTPWMCPWLQQLSFHAHHDERCFLPIHIYDTTAGRPVAVILRPGKTPSGKEAAATLCRLYSRIRHHWPTTHLTIRGDGHYGRPEMMDFCEKHGLDYLFGVTGTKALAGKIEDLVDPIRVERAQTDAPAVRGFAETRHGNKSRRASSPASRPHPWASISATSSPRYKPPAPRTSTPGSTAPAVRPRT